MGKHSDTSLQTDWSYERTNKGEAGELISLREKCNIFPSIYQWNTDKIDSPLYAAGNNVVFKCGNYEGWNFNSGKYLFTTDTK